MFSLVVYTFTLKSDKISHDLFQTEKIFVKLGFDNYCKEMEDMKIFNLIVW